MEPVPNFQLADGLSSWYTRRFSGSIRSHEPWAFRSWRPLSRKCSFRPRIYDNPAGFDNNEADYAAAPPQFALYGLPRNFFRGPGRTNLDLALAKTTPITERVAAEFRVEAFNIFNHTEFENPTVNPNSGTFGQITSTFDPRILQMALRITF